MRVFVGSVACAAAIFCASEGATGTLRALLASLILFGCGACLLIGFLTPVVSISVAIVDLAIARSWLPVVAGKLFEGKLASLEIIVMAIAIVLLGPGAYSLDARLFGRREIVIPPCSRARKY